MLKNASSLGTYLKFLSLAYFMAVHEKWVIRANSDIQNFHREIVKEEYLVMIIVG